MGKGPKHEGTLRPALEFLGRFGTAWLVGLGVLAVVPAIERSAIQATIAGLGIASHLMKIECVISGSDINIAGADLRIITDCTPIMSTLALWAAMFAFPAPVPWKLGGMATGVAVLWVFNLARVLTLAFVLRSHPTWFGFAHVYLWQSVTLLVVLAMFVAWVRLQRAT